MAQKKPEKVFRVGYVSCSIFAHEVESEGTRRTLRSASLQKRYQDGDEVKYTSSFGLAELPQAQAVLQLAFDYIAGKEAELTLGD